MLVDDPTVVFLTLTCLNLGLEVTCFPPLLWLAGAFDLAAAGNEGGNSEDLALTEKLDLE